MKKIRRYLIFKDWVKIMLLALASGVGGMFYVPELSVMLNKFFGLQIPMTPPLADLMIGIILFLILFRGVWYSKSFIKE